LNALLNQEVMPEGVTPTTDRITVVTYGEATHGVEEGITYRRVPVEGLEHLALVDTPGTNAVIEKHEVLTERFVPRADLVLFVTSADRPFTRSEREFLARIASWHKKIVLIVNKIDLLDEAADDPDAARGEVLDFVARHAREVLDAEAPPVFGVSARRARRAVRDGDEEALSRSGLPALRRYVQTELGDLDRLRLKLATPLGVGERLARDARGALEERLALLADDRATLEAVDRQRAQFEREMKREAETYLARIKTALLEVERRGEAFLDRTVRVGNVLNLMRPERVKQAFVDEVVRDADREIDEAMGEMVDWFVQRNLQLWEDVVGYVAERRKAGDDRVVGEVGGRFRMDRREVLLGLRDQAEAVLEDFDEEREATRLADSLQQSVVRSGLLQVSGVGLGAAVLAFVSSAAVDITGITLSLAVIGTGALILPRRRARAKRELHEQLQALRDGLEASLDRQLAHELERAGSDLAGAIAPYTRFVRSETERLTELAEAMETQARALADLRAEIEGLEPAEE
ncbi:MAG: dynamin family protein, partial [Jiangellaceae bacterium]